MKKLLLAGMVAIVFCHQANAMVFKRNEEKQFVPIIHAEDFTDRAESKDNAVLEVVTPLIVLAKGSDDKPVMVKAPIYLSKLQSKGECKPVYFSNKDGTYPMMQKTVLDKDAMKQWCDNFKKKSKKPGLWTRDAQEERIVEKVEYCTFERVDKKLLDNLEGEVARLNYEKASLTITDFEFFHRIEDLQKNEWTKWQEDVNKEVLGLHVAYEEPVSDKKQDFVYAGLQFTKYPTRSVESDKYCVIFDQSPYYKKMTNNDETDQSLLENNAYHSALQSLQVTKEVMEHNLRNVFWIQWLWNNEAYNNYQKSIQTLDNEIALFKDQDTIISPEKIVYDRGEQMQMKLTVMAGKVKGVIFGTDGKTYSEKLYLKSKLTRRDVFTRSCMSRTHFEQVKTARE